MDEVITKWIKISKATLFTILTTVCTFKAVASLPQKANSF